MTYLCKKPKNFTKEYIEKIDITELVEEYDFIITRHKNYDENNEMYYSPEIYKKIIIDRKFEFEPFYNKEYYWEELKKFYKICDKYMEKIIKIDGNLNQYKYGKIIRYTNKELINLFDMIKGTLIIFPERKDLPEWVEELPFPDFGGDEEGKYFQIFDGSGYYLDTENFTRQYRARTKDIIIIIDLSENEYELYYGEVGRTAHA